jgi:hypothetical protein
MGLIFNLSVDPIVTFFVGQQTVFSDFLWAFEPFQTQWHIGNGEGESRRSERLRSSCGLRYQGEHQLEGRAYLSQAGAEALRADEDRHW